MIHTIIKYLLISTTLFFYSCHKPKTDIITPAKQLIERQIVTLLQTLRIRKRMSGSILSKQRANGWLMRWPKVIRLC